MHHRFIFITFFLTVTLNHVGAQEDSPSVSKTGQTAANIDESKAWYTRRVAECESHDIVLSSSEGSIPLKFERASLLNWSNPIRNTPAGAVFIWTVEGRPQVIASTYPIKDGIEQELTSLSENPLVLNQGKTDEHRFPKGIEWREMPNVEAPSKQRNLRLVQMRRMAERFRVFGNGDNKFEARLLTQPIFRSSAVAMNETAVFAFVQGTDPEAVLLIETNGTEGWRYAFARMTMVPILANLDNELVWSLAWFGSSLLNDQPFHKIQYPGSK